MFIVLTVLIFIVLIGLAYCVEKAHNNLRHKDESEYGFIDKIMDNIYYNDGPLYILIVIDVVVIFVILALLLCCVGFKKQSRIDKTNEYNKIIYEAKHIDDQNIRSIDVINDINNWNTTYEMDQLGKKGFWFGPFYYEVDYIYEGLGPISYDILED